MAKEGRRWQMNYAPIATRIVMDTLKGFQGKEQVVLSSGIMLLFMEVGFSTSLVSIKPTQK
jgi:hypothetical protein